MDRSPFSGSFDFSPCFWRSTGLLPEPLERQSAAPGRASAVFFLSLFLGPLRPCIRNPILWSSIDSYARTYADECLAQRGRRLPG